MELVLSILLFEIFYLKRRHYILIYNILPDSKSPITLLEIGLFARSGKSVFVCCPSGFYRKGNIDVICARYSIPLYEDFDQLINDVKEILHN